ncbi:MAG: hypothetical protein WBJ68_18010 [Candidatus Dechloromonas phosphoritropha]
MEIDGEEYPFYKIFPINLGIMSGTTADPGVVQTALDLPALGKKVLVEAEAGYSRRPEDQAGAGASAPKGCRIFSREMVASEWLHKAGSDVFRQNSRNLLYSVLLMQTAPARESAAATGKS